MIDVLIRPSIFPVITLTSSQAQSYCLALAQVIPVFLLALFVLNNPLSKKSKKLLKRTAKLDKEQKQLVQKGKRLLVGHPEKERELIRTIVQADSMLLSLGTDRDLWEGKKTAVLRGQLIQARHDSEIVYRNLAKAGSNLKKKLDLPKDNDRKNIKFRHQEAVRSFRRSVVWTIAIGVVGEIFSLWTAVGIVGPRFGIAFTTNITVLMISLLSGSAIMKFTSAENAKRYKSLLYVWPILISCLAIIGYIDLITRLKIKG